ncbi:P-loop containing nucleoside triphosphate hydrolase protein [Sistotremastrum suecicum HHB10207 ss-3]|uniref:p-loop containing nucleoside triphosphate hydrolase protein n=1 Tax=Sistotremastrum suecicum HHB10207 ss-3 TaxID=1314776 RepID=A0A166BIG1_9AGAM|nr:P-loop containing nucleoside triphosphate hydrolase protein [Sistotremastrum suecicum HHB10207 ss-3]
MYSSNQQPFAWDITGAHIEELAPGFFMDLRTIPLYLSAISVILLCLHAFVPSTSLRKLYSRVVDVSPSSKVVQESNLKDWRTCSMLQALRVLASLFILGIQIILVKSGGLTINICLAAFCIYTSLLSLFALIGTLKWRYLVSRHVSLLYLFMTCIYLRRDVVPLADGGVSLDGPDGALGWARLALLAINGIWIPILLPRQYKPVDPENPTTPSASQTASYISRAFYFFLDPVIYKAFKSPALSFDDLPSLADEDAAKYLVETSFPILDPFQSGKMRRNFILSVLFYFRKQYVVMAILLLFVAVNEFGAPIAINRILSYLEGDQGTLKPWIWIIWLGAGPIINSLCHQGYTYISLKTVIRFEAIVTQLVFVHSLRVRLGTTMKQDGVPTSSIALPVPGLQEPAIDATGAHTTDVDVLDQTEDEASLSASVTALNSPVADSATIADNSSEIGKNASTAEEDIKKEKGPDQIGKINNMVSTDLKIIHMGSDWMKPFFFVIRICVCGVLLHRILGWSAFVGMGVFICMTPLPGILAKFMMKLQATKMKKNDARISAMSQAMNVLRMIKIFAWEAKVEDQLSEKREEELNYVLKSQWLGVATWALNGIFPLVTMLSTYATYTLVMKKEPTASTIYSSIAVFTIFQDRLFDLFNALPAILRAKVSLDRIGEFVNHGEPFRDPMDLISSPIPPEDSSRTAELWIRNAVFTWEKNASSTSGASTPRRASSSRTQKRTRNFRLQIRDELSFKTGKLNIICGPTGSGKTSMLMALLGEMYYWPMSADSGFNLPRDGGVAFAAQETWVLNETIRDNILFGAEYDKERFDKVIHQTGLSRDLSLFDAGDLTEVGEKGITLSGGQKARVTLARAVYSSAQILLLDDVLSALDVHTARWVAKHCFGGDLLRDRTVILVTHNLALMEPYAGYMVSLGVDGRVIGHWHVPQIPPEDNLHGMSESDEGEKDSGAKSSGYADPKDADETKLHLPHDQTSTGKLVVAEEMALGHVGFSALKLWLGELGGPFFFIACISGIFIDCIMTVVAKWFLGYWSSQYETHPQGTVPTARYLAMYGGILLFGLASDALAHGYWFWGGIRASRVIHNRLVRSILTSTFRWLDVTPISRVLSRCSQDCLTVDGPLPDKLVSLIFLSAGVICTVFAVVTQAGLVALGPASVVVVLGLFLGQVYMRAQLSVKRHMSNAKSPVLGHVGAALNGLVSIRAFGAQRMFEEESLRRIDKYSRAACTFWNLNRWLGVRMDTLAGLFTGFIAAYVVYGRNLSSGNVGFTLALLSGFSFQILYWVRLVNEVEVQGNSLERIQDFLNIDHEPSATEEGRPPAYWPASGELVVENFSAKYSGDGPSVLKDISFTLQSGERMGVVGRTGAGKSTVALALLRAIPTSGTVVFDGLDTSRMNLAALRSNVTLIPQHPELLAGTLRENLDPFNEHDDATLNDALRAAGLHRTQGSVNVHDGMDGPSGTSNVTLLAAIDESEEATEGRIGLDTEVASGGSNFSQGQRQIVAIARAILRRSKIVILDEATAAIDHETDRAIQESLRTQFKDATVITVAHRLQTIMGSDKIMVLDAGEVKEFDSPKTLLQRRSGFFKALVDESADRDALYKTVGL